MTCIYKGTCKSRHGLYSITLCHVRVPLGYRELIVVLCVRFQFKEDWIDSQVKGFYESGIVCVCVQHGRTKSIQILTDREEESQKELRTEKTIIVREREREREREKDRSSCLPFNLTLRAEDLSFFSFFALLDSIQYLNL